MITSVRGGSFFVMPFHLLMIPLMATLRVDAKREAGGVNGVK